MRSPYNVPGSTRLTRTLAALPASGRPSDGCTSALGTFQFAANPTAVPSVVGFAPCTSLLTAVLTRMSHLGMVYDAEPLTKVRNGSSMWQKRLLGLSGRTSQLSLTRRPVLVPPCTVRPLNGRAETL